MAYRSVEVYKSEFIREDSGKWAIDSNGKLQRSKEVIAKGKFHNFMSESSDGETYTVAIVELEDGTIIVPQALDVKFTDINPMTGGQL